MKINFKKIASVLASAAMLGSTIGIAAAANYPQPFVANGIPDAAIVIGAAGADGPAATTLAGDLAKFMTTAGPVSIEGENFKIETSSQKVYLLETLNKVKPSLTKDNLPNLLADQVITDEEGVERTYQQKLSVMNAQVKMDQTSDDLDEPVLYLDTRSPDVNYTLELVFPSAVNISKCRNQEMVIAGKTYTLSGNSAELSGSKITLYGTGNDLSIAAGQSKVVGDVTVKVLGVNKQTDKATIEVTKGGKTESASMTKGETKVISGVKIYARDVMAYDVPENAGVVRLFIGANKIVLSNGEEVEVDDEDVSGTYVSITNTSGTDISRIQITVTPSKLENEVEYIKMGGSMVDPVFGTFKISLNAVTPDLMSADRDKVVIRPSSDYEIKFEFETKSGSYNLVLLNLTSGNSTDANFSIGQKNKRIVSAKNTRIHEGELFITESGGYSQIWKLNNIKSDGTEIEVQDQASGSRSQKITIASGQGTLSLADGNSLTVYANSTQINFTSGVVDYIYTKNGLRINLSKVGTISPRGVILLQEETPYNNGEYKRVGMTNNLGSGNTFNITLAKDSNGYEASIGSVSMNGTRTQVGTTKEWRGMSEYGTYIVEVGDDDKQVTIYYPKEAAYFDVYVSETGATTQTQQSAGNFLTVFDNQVESVSSKNLLVVGGPCINTVAQQILGSSGALCGAQFTAATGVRTGESLIKVVRSPLASNKVAMLIAGYDSADTNAGVRYVIGNKPSTNVGTELKVVTATGAVAV